jgi:predicted solute-binding protein
VLAAAVPVGGLFRLGKQVEPLGRFGIAAETECRSVLFFSDRPFDRITDRCMIRLTAETASSLRLLYLLLGYGLGFDRMPTLAVHGRPANGELLIGDQALVRAWSLRYPAEPGSPAASADGGSFEHVTDLATQWFSAHGLPFVFARWVIRRDAPRTARQAIDSWLERFRQQENDLVAACVPTAAKTLGMPAEELVHYFKVIRRCLGDRDIEGQMRFIAEFEKYQEVPLFDVEGGDR